MGQDEKGKFSARVVNRELSEYDAALGRVGVDSDVDAALANERYTFRRELLRVLWTIRMDLDSCAAMLRKLADK